MELSIQLECCGPWEVAAGTGWVGGSVRHQRSRCGPFGGDTNLWRLPGI